MADTIFPPGGRGLVSSFAWLLPLETPSLSSSSSTTVSSTTTTNTASQAHAPSLFATLAASAAAEDDAASSAITDTNTSSTKETLAEEEKPLTFFERRSMSTCEETLEAALSTGTAGFMLRALQQLGCAVDLSYFSCEPRCGQDGMNIQGGFLLDEDGVSSIMVCANKVSSHGMMMRVLTHELIHAYDHCRALVDWSDCRHHACSEVRASNLSGDCHYSREVRRGNLTTSSQHPVCVKRRALLSVAANPACTGDVGRAALNDVFNRCYYDLAPFQSVP
jgi:inner membrane protease ATP23